jgi:hypothetical protein
MFRLLAAALALGLAHPPAYAYIDPNLGGWLYQLLFPLLLAIAGLWAGFRLKISEFFSTLAKRLRGK